MIEAEAYVACEASKFCVVKQTVRVQDNSVEVIHVG